MNSSSSIRLMDRHMGSVICLFFSWITRLFPRRAPRQEIRSILLVELFEMGASMMAIPSIRYIKKLHPQAEIYALTTKSIKASWEKLQEINPEHIFALDEKNVFSFFFSFLKARRRLNSLDLDVIIDYELFFRITAIFSFLIKAREKCGFSRGHLEGLYRGNVYSKGCQYNQNSHISRNFLALTKAVLRPTGSHPEYKDAIRIEELACDGYESSKEVFHQIKARLQLGESSPYFLIAPDVGPNLSCRNYPLDRFATVIRGLHADFPDCRIFLIGTRENVPACENLLKTVDGCRLESLAGKTTLDELFELLIFAKLLISNDNGPVHFATLTGTPTLALYSTDSPYVYGSLGKCLILYSFYQCSPCIMAYNHKHSSCRDNKCLQAIAAEEVLAAARVILRGEAKWRTINNSIPYLP